MLNNQITTVTNVNSVKNKAKLNIIKKVVQPIEEEKIVENKNDENTIVQTYPFVQQTFPIHNLGFFKINDKGNWNGSTLFGTKAFYRLWKKDEVVGEFKNKSLEEDVLGNEILSGKFVVQYEGYDNKTRLHLAFGTYTEFIRYILTIPTENWNFHEFIPGKQKQKIRFDIDINRKDCEEKFFNIKFVNSLRDIIIFQCITLLNDERLTLERDVVILSSHSQEKFSYHIIINRYVESYEHMAYIYKQIMLKIDLPQHQLKFVDNCYKNNCFFRMAFNTKPDQNRYLQFEDEWVYNGHPIIHQYLNTEQIKQDQRYIYIAQLVESFCSATGDAGNTPFYDFQLPDEKKLNYTHTDVDDNDFTAAFEFLSPDTQAQFSLGEVKDNLITLTREHPGYCGICNREHENSDGYLRISNGTAYLHCYRAEPQSKCIAIGIIKQEEAVAVNTTTLVAPATPIHTPETFTIEQFQQVKFNSIPDAEALLRVYWDHLHHLIDLPTVDLRDSNCQLPSINFTEHPVYAVRANCGMGKSKALIDCLRQVSPETKVLAISFRRTLDRKILEDFNDAGLNFDWYENKEVKGKIRAKRLVVQIDSLYKVRGKFDILILDEFEYVGMHLVNFVKEKLLVYNTLVNYIKRVDSIYVADALLSNSTVDFLTQCGRPPYVYVNDFEKHSEKTVYVVPDKLQLTEMILESVRAGQKVVVPSNCQTFVTDLATKIKKDFPSKKVGLYTANPNTGNIDPAKEWGNLDVLLFSPTIVAGTSFVGKNFDVSYGYFTSKSAIAEMSFQQNFRVRNLNTNKMYICVAQRAGSYVKVSNDITSIMNWIIHCDTVNRLDLIVGVRTDALKFVEIDYEADILDVNDPFFGLYAWNFKRTNESHTNYLLKLLALLQSQGIKWGGITTLRTEKSDAIANDIKVIHTLSEEEKLNQILVSPNITHLKYIELCNNPNRTQEEQSAMNKHRFQRAYHLKPETVITTDVYKTYQPLISQHRTLELLLPIAGFTPQQQAERDEYLKGLLLQLAQIQEKETEEQKELRFQKLLDDCRDTRPAMIEVHKKMVQCIREEEEIMAEKVNSNSVDVLCKNGKLRNKVQQLCYAFQLLQRLDFIHPFYPPDYKVKPKNNLELTDKFIQENREIFDKVFPESNGPYINKLKWINDRLASVFGIKIFKKGKQKDSPYTLNTMELWKVDQYEGKLVLLPIGI